MTPLLPLGWGARHTFAVMTFLGLANVFATRVSLSVAIVAMVNHTEGPGTGSDIGDECPLNDISNNEVTIVIANNRIYPLLPTLFRHLKESLIGILNSKD